MVVDGDREDLLGLLLADDVVVEEGADLARVGEVVEAELARLGELFLDDLVAEVDALVADVDAGTGDQLLDLLLRLAAERALQQLAGVTELGHGCAPPLSQFSLTSSDRTCRSTAQRIGPVRSIAWRDEITVSMMPYVEGLVRLPSRSRGRCRRGPARAAGRCVRPGSPRAGRACAGSPWPPARGR